MPLDSAANLDSAHEFRHGRGDLGDLDGQLARRRHAETLAETVVHVDLRQHCQEKRRCFTGAALRLGDKIARPNSVCQCRHSKSD